MANSLLTVVAVPWPVVCVDLSDNVEIVFIFRMSKKWKDGEVIDVFWLAHSNQSIKIMLIITNSLNNF